MYVKQTVRRAQIELFYDRGNFYDFTCILRELDTPGVLSSVTQRARRVLVSYAPLRDRRPPRYPFDFSNAEKPYESYNGQQKRAKFPTSKAHISAVFHSFWLIFGRAIISRNGLEAWMLFPERARAEHSR